MMQHRYQNGSLTKRSNRFSEDVWQFRFYETTLEGSRSRKSISVGTLAQFPTKSDALRVIETASHPTESKTEASQKPLPIDRRLACSLEELRKDSLHKSPQDWVFSNRAGRPRAQQDILRRHSAVGRVVVWVSARAGEGRGTTTSGALQHPTALRTAEVFQRTVRGAAT